MASPRVIVAVTLDTKGEEADFLRSELENLGVATLLVDTSIAGKPAHTADIPCDEIARLGGGDIESIRQLKDRSVGLEVMRRGLATLLRSLLQKGEVAGYIGIGGGTNASISESAFRTLPYGIPKMLVSTVASGDTQPFIGTKDVMLFYPVVDILGLNSFSRTILRRAAAAMSAMVTSMPQGTERLETSRTSLTVGMTTYGATTAGAMIAKRLLEEKGCEVWAFHARGTGGLAMEELIYEGQIGAVLDLTTTEVPDELVGGIHSAGPHRLEAAGQMGIPQIVIPGAIDMVNFGPLESVPTRFRDRKLLCHTPMATLMRTNPTENREMGEWIANKLNRAKGPCAVVIPVRGFSSYDREGKPFFDPESDLAFREAIRKHLKPHVRYVEVDGHINDEHFIRYVCDLLLDLCNLR